MNRCLVLVSVVIASAGFDCGDGGEDMQGDAICDKLVSCAAMTSERCTEKLLAFVLPQGCETAIMEATCEELREEDPAYMYVCFPPCTGDYTECSGDRISGCIVGRSFVADCEEVCISEGETYSGVCDDEYQGQESSTGMDVCWCI